MINHGARTSQKKFKNHGARAGTGACAAFVRFGSAGYCNVVCSDFMYTHRAIIGLLAAARAFPLVSSSDLHIRFGQLFDPVQGCVFYMCIR